MTARVLIAADAAGTLLVHLQACFPEEGCGLLLGRAEGSDVRIERVEPGANIAADRNRTFEIDPGLRLRVQRAARGDGLDVVGHFHAHPHGEPEPSATDIARAAAEPELVWLIAGMRWGGVQGIAAWRFPDGAPVRLELVDDD
jgi:proteasome lid subunit RPN8/RPN11